MIEYFKQDRSMEMICDTCQDISTFYGEFPTCIKEAREEGWKNYKLDDQWVNTCPMCANKTDDATEVFK